MDQIRHTYLHYEVEPLVYARAAAMDRLLPLLKPVQDAPLDFIYKSDIVALITECLIKAIEARTMDVGLAKPSQAQRAASAPTRSTTTPRWPPTTARPKPSAATLVELAMRQGWVLTDYFYDQLGQMEHDTTSLKDNIGQMVYGMDVDRERRARPADRLPSRSHARHHPPRPPPSSPASTSPR